MNMGGGLAAWMPVARHELLWCPSCNEALWGGDCDTCISGAVTAIRRSPERVSLITGRWLRADPR